VIESVAETEGVRDVSDVSVARAVAVSEGEPVRVRVDVQDAAAEREARAESEAEAEREAERETRADAVSPLGEALRVGKSERVTDAEGEPVIVPLTVRVDVAEAEMEGVPDGDERAERLAPAEVEGAAVREAGAIAVREGVPLTVPAAPPALPVTDGEGEADGEQLAESDARAERDAEAEGGALELARALPLVLPLSVIVRLALDEGAAERLTELERVGAPFVPLGVREGSGEGVALRVRAPLAEPEDERDGVGSPDALVELDALRSAVAV
jgi:hypothetical protein